MKLFYPVVLGILVLLSVFDLIVGLINDAVNFLNSAIGSQVASRKIIMVFSSLGILLGALLSSGMMEVARKGVFNPSLFSFSDIIYIYLSVMISDIILLDLFNTLGLPTSTTVSMVFCLLGGAFSIATIKILYNHEPFHLLQQYVRAEKAFNISIGIFLSIIISFISGSFIHYFIRVLFSFDYKPRLKFTGVIWSAISLSSMTYFLIIKGLQNTLKVQIHSPFNVFLFYIHHVIDWSYSHWYTFFFILFSTWALISKIFVSLGYNILKFVVLYGTFSLAMAFSGNDLVNFVGISIASMQSYNIWKNNGYPPAEKFTMNHLSEQVHVPSLFLICSGLIMIITLWFSKKTKHITNTELNLSSQHEEGTEQFVSNSFSRGMVRLGLFLGNKFFRLFPKRLLVKIEKNFKNYKKNEKNRAFDLVRASANLTISSILISLATIQKLPVSTTFVTFMVSMGTSFSDRAWDRESAVYRISGVMKVIRGWFLTGLMAFVMAGLTATFLYFFKSWALLIMMFLIAFIFYKSYQHYSHRTHDKKEKLSNDIVDLNLEKTLEKTLNFLYPILEYIENMDKNTIEGIINENVKILKNSRNTFFQVKKKFTEIQNSLIPVIRTTTRRDPLVGIFYLKIYNHMKEMVESYDIFTYHPLFHVINSHKPLKYKQKRNLLLLEQLMLEHIHVMKRIIMQKHCKEIKFPCGISHQILQNIETFIHQQSVGIGHDQYGKKNTFLMLDLLLSSKKITKNIEEMMYLYCDMFSKHSLFVE
ncbi:inorganic phosphate transporter [Blattabacterium cuenoti]|uniref:inorganic phosphate transporter n=1 Tax=Blattabacterium cuenoti TaxID=1653831 RepID=UPI00163D1A86|nr:inorganic phosphate transporter [Blattabacterium cuenoti]